MSFADSLDVFANGDSVEENGSLIPDAHAPEITTEFLIVGTGPAGASLACFMASYGLFSGNRAAIQTDSRRHFRVEWHHHKPILKHSRHTKSSYHKHGRARSVARL